ncbi:MAG: CopG family transcriptional regulator [Hydrogenophaga sp.]|nr:CopG family transcriptional regulator [Hydrogenophaga sp.]
MAVSVRMDPLLEKQLEQAARRKGITKSQFIIDAVQRALGRKNPYELMLKVKEEMAHYSVQFEAENAGAAHSLTDTDAPVEGDSDLSTGEKFRRILEAKHQAELKDWTEFQAQKAKRAVDGGT